MPICSDAVINYSTKRFYVGDNDAVDIFEWEDKDKYEPISVVEKISILLVKTGDAVKTPIKRNIIQDKI
eukprot:snap_masked-scaffold_3-processed-gene-1.27-mRNA-1 protein AED:1.00 eAED:1.00 QI:0/-1/0/0/-1/1/1/0/68